MRKKNKGFTLVEMVVTVSIFAILLGILVPSLNSIIGFRVQRAANSIASALDKTKIEASNRLVGEMRLEKRANGYYISYILDRGKVDGKENIKWNEDEEKIAPAKTLISYKVENSDEEIPQNQNESYWNDLDVAGILEKGFTGGDYCSQIIISGGGRKRIINLFKDTGKYEIQAG